MTKEAYIAESKRRTDNWKNEEWQKQEAIREKEYIENFVQQPAPDTELLNKLEKCLLAQKWISAKSSPHQYTLMKDFTDIDGVEFDDITDAIGKYGFLWVARWGKESVYQYLKIGDFFYWSSLYPSSWELINRARIDQPPFEAYFSNFEGKWSKIGKIHLPGRPYNERPYSEPTQEDIEKYSPELLFELFKKYYEKKQKEYEQELITMGEMKPENRNIPDEIYDKVKTALESQRYITAKPEANPHQYCLRKKWVSVIKTTDTIPISDIKTSLISRTGETSFNEIAQIIRDYGYVEWFWKKPYMILNVGDFKYWTMGFPLDVTILINRTLIRDCTRVELLKL